MLESEREIAKIKCINFPLLAMNIHSNLIVLFSENYKGVIIHKANGMDDIGTFKNCWVDCFDEEVWQILPAGSSVTITQV